MTPVELPKRFPLVVTLATREADTTTDARLVNCFIERTGEDSFDLYKRPGWAIYYTQAAATGRGIYRWKTNIYTIVGNTLYKDNVAVAGTVDTTNGVYTFSECLGATNKLFMYNGVEAYTYDPSGGLVNVTDADFPAAGVKGSAYLDGTTYVMLATAHIQGSGLNDPTSWDPLNDLVAQIEPDGGVCLAKQLVYVVALKEKSVEAFYDAGNATGSPLGPVQGVKISTGCRHADTVRDLDGILFWVGQSDSGGLNVMAMEGMKSSTISTPVIDRILQNADFTTVYSWAARVGGHIMYVLTLVNANLTLVYDVTSKWWYQWTDALGNYIPFVGATDSTDKQTLVQHADDGKVYKLDMGYYNDNGSLFAVDIYTPNFDGGVRLTKYMGNLCFIADQTPGSILQVRKSDDDYRTWSNFREVDLGKKNPRLTKNGSFDRRAYHLRHKRNTPLRIRAMEMPLTLGPI